MHLSGKRALVTGAAGGIGTAIVQALRAAGAQVAAADQITDGLDADYLLPGDLSNDDYAEYLPVAASEAMGGLDIVVNNAGVMRRGKVTDSNTVDFDSSVAINVRAPFLLCRAAIPLMAERGGGAIVNTASCWGLRPGPDEVDTAMLRSGFERRGFDPDTAVAELDETVPLGRIAQPRDIADVVLFLASDQSRYMCGALVEVNGGKAVG